MTLSATLQRHLRDRRVAFEVVSHPVTGSSSETAQASHISGNRIAKAVVLREGDAGDGYLVAVLPASHRLSLERLRAFCLELTASFPCQARHGRQYVRGGGKKSSEKGRTS